MKITSVTPKTDSFKIEIKNNVFTIGSCFSVEIAKYLEKNGINVVCNPFGTIYNPYSIFKELEILYNGDDIDPKNLIFENGVFFSPYCSTEFDGETENEALKKINDTISEYRKKIKESDVFIITFGTAIVYKIKKSGEITANCHKLPDNIFEKT
ncbi:MAG TPA: GSCFA domain-containing protein, partial [Spirochaetota bacterium]|nr:GSCFA domain-containing protein [Spirochaetota bacterium]